MNYTIDYFINKFSVIPDRLWNNGELGEEHTSKCALGHCGVADYKETEEAVALGKFLEPIVINLHPGEYFGHVMEYVYTINDGGRKCDPTLGTTPKERILKALELAKAYFPSTEKEVSQPVRELVTK